ncbi:MAG TPA: YigZ family protein [Clostridia bacterium]|nr:YigZ family protein [Clostridia bacterium]
MSNYKTVQGEFQTKYEILRSVFICTTKGVESFEQGIEFYREIAKKYSNATHNCYALTTCDSQKFSDDGEPQGTAGQPILQVIKNNNLINVVCVVTRYFGGIKLGTGGLVSAYTKSVADCLKEATIVTKTKSLEGKIVLDYNEFSAVNNYIKSNNFIVLDTVYNDLVELSIALPYCAKQEFNDTISRITAGKKEIEYIKETYHVY